jgi:uncharacterized SAM-binding protein YcdF (DUF218 family)
VRRKRRLRRLVIFLALLALALVAATAPLYVAIRRSAVLQPTRSADVIIVLGAGIRQGFPGRCYLPRLDHARSLFMDDWAAYVIVTEKSPAAEVARDYLWMRGLPREAIFLEDRSVNTWENLLYARGIMREEGWRTAIIVTCPFHVHRSMRMARDLGIDAEAAAAPFSPTEKTVWRHIKYTLRECYVYAKYRLLGP